MKRSTEIYAVAVLFIFLFIGCESDGCLNKNSSESLIEWQTAYFNDVNIQGLFDVILIQDTAHYVEFETKPSFHDHLSAKVLDSVLTLENSNDCFYKRDFSHPKAYVHFSEIHLIDAREACKITSELPITSNLNLIVTGEMAEVDIELNSQHFNFYNHSTSGGSFTFRGNSKNAFVAGFYTAKFKLDALEVQTLQINNSSIGDFSVQAKDRLYVRIHNRGNIYYSGNPEVIIDSISGTGKLIQLTE